MPQSDKREPQIDRYGREVVRVKHDETDFESTQTKEWADLFSEGVTVLDKPAVDIAGEWLPTKPLSSVSAEAEKKKAATSRGSSSTQNKEQ